MRKNDGKDSEALFDDIYVTKHGIIWYKFVDTHRARSFVPTQPADRLLIHRGQAWLVEIKSSIDPVRFPFKNISKKQVGYGRYWRIAGAKEVFIIHHLITDNFYFVPFDIVDQWFKDSKASIKWEELLQFKEDKYYEFYNHLR